MTLSMHAASAPVFTLTLGNMLNWFELARRHAQARKFEPDNFLGLRLAPDMLPLSKQVQIATDNAKGCVARLAGLEVPAYPDDERTLDELAARVRRTIDFVVSVPAAQVDGSEARRVVLTFRNMDPIEFDGQSYLTRFALPNFFFHATTTYALLRHAGVELGKRDFLGG